MSLWHIVGFVIVFAIGAYIGKNTSWLSAVPGL